MKNLALIFIIIWLLMISGGFTYVVYYQNLQNQNRNKLQNHYSNLLSQQINYYPDYFTRERKLKDITEIQAQEIKYTGWIPDWAIDSGIKSLIENVDKFDSISPVFYEIDNNGEIKSKIKRLDSITEISTLYKIKLIPTISSFSADGISKLLQNFEKFNEFILAEVDSKNYNGIDLNYELIYLKDKDKFFEHIKQLKKELEKRNKFLYVTVLSKWGDNINYSFAPQTRSVHDYIKIGEIADKVRIMTYDYTSQSSTIPGPIAPIKWIEQVLIYATNRINPSKISLGIHLYGYVWTKTQDKATALNYRQIAQLKNNLSTAETFYSEVTKESIIKYVTDGNFYFGYYSSPESIKDRLNLASKYGIKEVSFWRLGDDPL